MLSLSLEKYTHENTHTQTLYVSSRIVFTSTVLLLLLSRQQSSLNFNSAEIFMALHVVYGIIIMLLLFLLCFLISFNLTQEQQKRLYELACLLVHSFVECCARENLFFSFFILSSFCTLGMAIFNSRIYHCRCYLYVRYKNLLLEYVSTEELNPITDIGFYGILYYIFLLFTLLNFFSSSLSRRNFFFHLI